MQNVIFVAGHPISGYISFTGNSINAFEAEAPTGDSPFSIPSAVLGVITAASQGSANVLAPKDPIQNPAVSTFSIMSGPAQNRFRDPNSNFPGLVVNDGRATDAVVNDILVVPALFVTGWHFYDLSNEPRARIGQRPFLARCRIWRAMSPAWLMRWRWMT